MHGGAVMNGCTGRCNQGRACTCFEGAGGFELKAARVAIEVAAVLVAVSAGYVWAQSDAATACETEGQFTAWGAGYSCSVEASK